MRGLVLLWWAVAYCWRRHAATIKPSSEHTQPPQAQTNTEDTDQQQLPPETSPWTQTTPWDQPTLHAPAVPGLQLQLRAAASTPAATQADAPVQTPQPDDQEQCGSHGGTAQPTTRPTGPTHAESTAHGQQAQPEEPPQQQQQPPPQTSPGGSFGPGERNNDPWGYYAPAYDPDTDPWHHSEAGDATAGSSAAGAARPPDPQTPPAATAHGTTAVLDATEHQSVGVHPHIPPTAAHRPSMPTSQHTNTGPAVRRTTTAAAM